MKIFKVLNKVTGMILVVSFSISMCISTLANTGDFYSYDIFNYSLDPWYYDMYEGCPDEIIEFIQRDDLESLSTFIELNDIEGQDLCIRPDQILESDSFKCILCNFASSEKGFSRAHGEASPISLLEYAVSCDAIKCANYLINKDVRTFSGNIDDLMLSAIVSGNFEMIYLVEKLGASVCTSSLYTNMRMAYTGSIENRNMISRWLLEKDVLNKLKKDEAESALGFFILAENDYKGDVNHAWKISENIRKTVEILIGQCCSEREFSCNLAAMIIAAPKTNNPLYIKLKHELEDFITKDRELGYQLRIDVVRMLADSIGHVDLCSDKLKNVLNFFDNYISQDEAKRHKQVKIGSALHDAVIVGDVDLTERLINAMNVDVNSKEGAYGNYTALGLAVARNDLRIVELLLKSGADVNVVVSDKEKTVSALQYAKFKKNIQMISLLKEYGAKE